MNQHIIDWNLERAAEELTWANRAQVRLSTDPQQFAHERESVEECRHMAGMHIASANAIADKRTKIGLLDAANTSRRAAQARVAELTEQVQKLGRELHRHKLDTARLDWLADMENNIGNVQLPTECVQAHPESLRAAIDAAMSMEGGAV